MDRALSQLTCLSSLVPVPTHGQIKGYGKTSPRTVRMICNLQVSPLRMASFPGLRGSSALGTKVRTGLDFHYKVGPTIFNLRRKSTQFVPKAMFERFTEKAIKVIMLAQEESKRLGHCCVGPEQILLGLIEEGNGIAAKVLKSMGINLEDARIEMEKIIGWGNGVVLWEVPFTPGADRVLLLSLEEARKLGHDYIGPEHLLLGLLSEGEGVAEKILESLGTDPNSIRTQVIRMVGERPKSDPRLTWRTSLDFRWFERFTAEGIKVIILAQKETYRLGHNFVGTEQILLGLIEEGNGIAAKVLKPMGINLEDARIEMEKIIGRGNGVVSWELQFTPGAERVLLLSLEEARQLGHDYIGTEHLLLGLLGEGEGAAMKFLDSLGTDPNSIRTQVIRMVGERKIEWSEKGKGVKVER